MTNKTEFVLRKHPRLATAARPRPPQGQFRLRRQGKTVSLDCLSTHAYRSCSVTRASLVELLKLLLLEGSGLGEAKGDFVGGKLGEGVGDDVELVLNLSLVERVELDGLGEASGLGDTGAAANNGGGHNDVVKEGGVHGLEGAGARALLAGVSDLSLGVNSSVDDDDDVLSELLLEVVDELSGDALVELEGSEGDLDQDVLGGGAVGGLELNLFDGVDVHHAQVLLDLFV